MRRKAIVWWMIVGVLAICLLGSCTQAPGTPSPSVTPSSVVTLSPSVAPSPSVMKWRMVGTESASHFTSTAVKKFADLVKQRTNGAIDITYYPEEMLIKSSDIAPAMIRGTVEMAAPSLIYVADTISFANFLAIPFAGVTLERWQQLTSPGGGIWAEFSKALDERGLELVGLWGTGWVGGASHKPVRTIEDFKGMKIRTSGANAIAGLGLLGAETVYMTGSEAVEALRTKIIDATEIALPSFDARGYAAFTPYFNKWYSWALWDGLLISKAVLNSLPPTLREIITSTGSEISEEARKTSAIEEAKAQDNIVKKGVTIIELPADQQRLAGQKCETIWEKWAAQHGVAGQRVYTLVKEAR